MNIEQYVPTQETCVALKKQGFSQRTEFHWRYEGTEWIVTNDYIVDRDMYAAPTAPEMMAELDAEKLTVCALYHGKFWGVRFVTKEGTLVYHSHTNPGEAVAQAYLQLKRMEAV